MKKLKDDIFTRLLLTFTAVIIFILGGIFFIFKYFLQELVSKTSIDSILAMDEFYAIMAIVALLSFSLLVLVYIIIRNIRKRVSEDVESLSKYLHYISVNKKYDEKVEIKHYFEFLQISVLLKNLIKRLRAKSKKK